MAEVARKRRAVFASREDARQKWAERGVFSDWDPRALQGYLHDGFRDRADGQVELQCTPEVEAVLYEEGPKFHIFSEVKILQTLTTLYHATQSPFRRDLAERLATQSDFMKLASIESGHLVPMTDPDLVAAQLLTF